VNAGESLSEIERPRIGSAGDRSRRPMVIMAVRMGVAARAVMVIVIVSVRVTIVVMVVRMAMWMIVRMVMVMMSAIMTVMVVVVVVGVVVMAGRVIRPMKVNVPRIGASQISSCLVGAAFNRDVLAATSANCTHHATSSSLTRMSFPPVT
jgi:hypothetical protein